LEVGIETADLFECLAFEGKFWISGATFPEAVTVPQLAPSRGGVVPMPPVSLMMLVHQNAPSRMTFY